MPSASAADSDDSDDSDAPDVRLPQLTISNSGESVASSVQSDLTETLSDEEEFCIINEAGWGIAVSVARLHGEGI